MAEKLDWRFNAFRPDLAAGSLRGRVKADRYVEGEGRQVTARAAPLRRAPAHNAALDSELLFGERVVVYDEQDGWAWCQSRRDEYVGYTLSSALSPPGAVATHMVTALCTHVYLSPDIKTPPIGRLNMTALVSVAEQEQRFAKLNDHDGYVFADHLGQLSGGETDPVSIAERFMGVPYLWGGRTNTGLDCSALIQLAFHATGQSCPRDSDVQGLALGRVLSDGEQEALQRGDIVFWDGHVGFMQDAGMLLHANAFHMMVVTEPLRPAFRRIEETGGGKVTSIRRL